MSGWSVTIVAQTVFALSLPDGWRIAGLGLGMTVGMTVGGALMLGYVVAARGRAAMAGLGRALGAAVAGGAAGFLAGAWAASGIGAVGVWANLGVTLLAAVVAVAVGAGVVVLVDRDDARAVAGVLRRRAPGG
ncbi:hypothetical protein ACFSTC_23115 [Nonomuraea ferruginea]